MLHELTLGERTVSQLAEPFSMSLAAAPKHIKALGGGWPHTSRDQGRQHIVGLMLALWPKRTPGSASTRNSGAPFSMILSTSLHAISPRSAQATTQAEAERKSLMSDHRQLERRSGVLTEQTTMLLRRQLPGPIEHVWAYLTESELRQQWLAWGDDPANRCCLRTRISE